jgi:hypothetical protein
MFKITNCGKDLRKNEMDVWGNEVEEDFFQMGITNKHVTTRDLRKWKKTVVERKVQNGP